MQRERTGGVCCIRHYDFVDAVYGVVPEDSKEKLAGVLTDEEYKTVTDRGCKVRFKYLTFINELLGL